MRFIDEVEILIQAGKGGNGCTSFLREKFRPKGGPDGGDGGRGGDVVLLADRRRNTLLELHLQRHYRAEAGTNGRGKNRHGRKGKDRTIQVPVGTLIRDGEDGTMLEDLRSPGQRFRAGKGGEGGRGNAKLVTSACRLPEVSETGHPGESKRLRCELKLLADVGIVGFPNAGKSTLIGSMSSAKPKIGDYPFTTLVPQLGLVRVSQDESFVIADIPGILPGASRGVGLGLRFLRHIERASVLLFLIDLADPEEKDPLKAYGLLREELSRFSSRLLEKKRIVAFNKMDLPAARPRMELLRNSPEFDERSMCFVSAMTKKGLPSLTRSLFRSLQEMPQGGDVPGFQVP